LSNNLEAMMFDFMNDENGKDEIEEIDHSLE
jgi:hypothetical protein